MTFSKMQEIKEIHQMMNAQEVFGGLEPVFIGLQKYIRHLISNPFFV